MPYSVIVLNAAYNCVKLCQNNIAASIELVIATAVLISSIPTMSWFQLGSLIFIKIQIYRQEVGLSKTSLLNSFFHMLRWPYLVVTKFTSFSADFLLSHLQTRKGRNYCSDKL